MTRHDHEPLTPEERALAERLARLGPYGGPSPALDAKILAAAHDAVARAPRRNRRRWLGLSGGAGGLVTGLGLAASLTLVLGVVWQLRPGDKALPQMGEGPAGEVEHVILVDALPSSEPRTRIVEPPPASAAAAPAAADDAAEARRSDALTTELPAPRHRVTPQPRLQSGAPAEGAGADREAREEAPVESAQAKAAVPHGEPAGSGQDAAAAAPDAFPAATGAAPAPVADTPRRATYTRAARAQAERTARPQAGTGFAESPPVLREAPAAYPASPPAPAPAAAADAADAVSGADSAAQEAMLDRVEVTGSRIVAPVAAIPLHEDSTLAPAEWLERVRTRRAAGDTAAARESLRRFVRAHPRVRLPDDLRELLATADDAGAGAP